MYPAFFQRSTINISLVFVFNPVQITIKFVTLRKLEIVMQKNKKKT